MRGKCREATKGDGFRKRLLLPFNWYNFAGAETTPLQTAIIDLIVGDDVFIVPCGFDEIKWTVGDAGPYEILI